MRQIVHTLLMMSLCLSLLNRDPCYSDEQGKPESRFSIERDDLILIPVELFGRKCQFVLDTGASCCVVDEVFRSKLGLPIDQLEASTPTKNQTLTFFRAPELKIGTFQPPLLFRGERVICADLVDCRSATDREAWGVLGMDFLRSRILRIDFDQLSGAFCSDATANFHHVERLQFSKGNPHVLMSLPSEGFKSFVVDTGGEWFLSLESALFWKLVDRRKIAVKNQIGIAQANGRGILQTGILESIEFGPHRFNNVPVQTGTENMMGIDFLRRFEVEFDFPNRIARFRPGRRIDLAVRRNWTGLGVRRVSGVTFVMGSDESSPAGQAGLREGDQLCTINGIAMEEFKLQKLRDLLRASGTEVTITFQRDQQKKQAVLVIPSEVNPFPGKPPHEVIPPAADFDQ